MYRMVPAACLLALCGSVGRGQAPAADASKVLARWVGTWTTEVVIKPAAWTPKERKVTGMITCHAILGGKFVEEAGRSVGEDTEHRVLWGYDAQKKVYRSWFFDSQGSSTDHEGQWDEKTRTMKWKRDMGNGLLSQAEHRFLDDDTYEWTTTITDRGGKRYLDVRGKHTRAK